MDGRGKMCNAFQVFPLKSDLSGNFRPVVKKPSKEVLAKMAGKLKDTIRKAIVVGLALLFAYRVVM